MAQATKLDNFSRYFVKRDGDIREKSIQRWHLASDIYASGIWSSGIFDELTVNESFRAYCPTTAENIYPYADSTYDIGSPVLQWNDIYANYFHGDGSNLTNLPSGTFGALLDGPGGLHGHSGESIRVNTGETHLEYYTPSLVTSFLELTDTPSDYTDWAGSGVRVNDTEDGLEFYATAAHAPVSFLGLTDTPLTYSGMESSGVRVNQYGNGLEFYPTSEGGGGSGYATGVGYSTTFDDGDLIAGVLTVTHNLGIRYNIVQIFDNNFEQIIPDSITLDSTTECSVDLSSFVPIAGTWYVVVAGGGGTSNHADLSNLNWAAANHTIDADILPTASGLYDIGSKTVPFASGYFKEVNAKNAIVYDHEYDNEESGSSKTISWINGNKQRITVTEAPATLTFEDPPGACNLILRCIQGTGGSKTITWPDSVVWQDDTAPTLSTTAGYVDIAAFYFDGWEYWGQASIGFYR